MVPPKAFTVNTLKFIVSTENVNRLQVKVNSIFKGDKHSAGMGLSTEPVEAIQGKKSVEFFGLTNLENGSVACVSTGVTVTKESLREKLGPLGVEILDD